MPFFTFMVEREYLQAKLYGTENLRNIKAFLWILIKDCSNCEKPRKVKHLFHIIYNYILPIKPTERHVNEHHFHTQFVTRG